MQTVKISTRHDAGKIVATARVDGKRKQTTVHEQHTSEGHASAAYALCQRIGDTRTATVDGVPPIVKGGFDFTVTFK